ANGTRPPAEIAVHPVSLTAAEIDDPADGLQAKFSIPYLTAYTLMRGAPTVETFRAVDEEVRAAARGVTVRTDPSLGEPEAILDGETRVEAAVGSPRKPMTEERLAAKLQALAGDRLDGALDDPERPAAELAARLG
ncbi:MAG: MmgE/PrpD family protein, partial [Actinomycetota bacterium]|nr:MmgE/PrpD family protein [Actinomycetota bacterium]